MNKESLKANLAVCGFISAFIAVGILGGCRSDADVASSNISAAADNFEVTRRVVFYNAMTGEYMLSIEGLCSLGNGETGTRMSVTCKTARGEYVKHFLGLSATTTFFAEQMRGVPASAHHYRIEFKPQAILPDIRLNTSAGK